MNTREIVSKALIDLERPFSKKELYEYCNNNGIDDVEEINKIMDFFCEIGTLKFTEEGYDIA